MNEERWRNRWAATDRIRRLSNECSILRELLDDSRRRLALWRSVSLALFGLFIAALILR